MIAVAALTRRRRIVRERKIETSRQQRQGREGWKSSELGGKQSQAQTDALMDQSKPKQLTLQSLAVSIPFFSLT